MLHRLRVSNFKAFAEMQSMLIRPITLIYGANSAGKSSILHSLLLARSALTSPGYSLNVHRAVVGDESVDLGGFRQYLHGHVYRRRFGLGIEVVPPGTKLQVPLLSRPARSVGFELRAGLDLTAVMEPRSGSSVHITQYHAIADGQSFLQFRHDEEGVLRVDRLPAALLDTLVQLVRAEVGDETEPPVSRESIQDLLSSLVFSDADMLGSTREHLNSPDGKQILLESSAGYDTGAGSYQGRPLLGMLREALISAVATINGAVLDDLSDLVYVGPVRSYPPRHFTMAQATGSGWTAGTQSWEQLRTDAQLREEVNRWLSAPAYMQTPYMFITHQYVNQAQLLGAITRHMLDIERDADQLRRADKAPSQDKEANRTAGQGRDRDHLAGEPTQIIKSIHEESFLAESLIQQIQNADADRVDELILEDSKRKTMVTHRDIGIGVSQVIPVLVEAFAARGKRRLVAIEQPELHLHPRLQAELGDVFINNALTDRTNGSCFLLETHSEYLILRIMRRIRETTRGDLPEGVPAVYPDDVSLLFVHPVDDSTGAVVQSLRLGEEGQLLDQWPGGFFEEGFRERFS